MSDHIAPDVLDRQRAVSAAIIEKILNDVDFRQHLVDAPEGALRAAGFLDEYVAVTSEMQGEVAGYSYEIEGDLTAPEDSRSCGCCITGIY